jgi:hypothetical protein
MGQIYGELTDECIDRHFRRLAAELSDRQWSFTPAAKHLPRSTFANREDNTTAEYMIAHGIIGKL